MKTTIKNVLKRGFTLIELLVVIAIIGVLSTIVLVTVNQSRSKARNAAMSQALVQYINAFELYKSANNNTLPSQNIVFPACLGIASGGCGGNGLTGTDSVNLRSAIQQYISPSSVKITQTNPAFSGVVYSCETATCNPDKQIFLTWYLEGTGKICARGAYSTDTGSATKCEYILGNGSGGGSGTGQTLPEPPSSGQN